MISNNYGNHLIKFQPCPGDLEDYPSSTACRISELGDGTIIEQTVTPNDLCDEDDLHMFLLGIARKYRVGDGNLIITDVIDCLQSSIFKNKFSQFSLRFLIPGVPQKGQYQYQ